jgi:rfaE bifunctional protein kinase chain/domain
MNLEKLKHSKIAVIGDLICDKYIFGSVERISPEAPVPVVRVEKERYYLGGASNVAINLKNIGCSVYLFGVIGKDRCGEKLLGMIRENNIDTSNIISLDDRPTTSKTRVIAHSQQIVRFDKEETIRIEKKHLKDMIKKIKEYSVDAVIVSDYGKGVVSEYLIDEVNLLDGVFISVDPKVNNANMYKNVDIITPNTKEAQQMSQIEINSFKNGVELAAKKILSQSNAKYLLITQGEKGMTLFNKEGVVYHQPSKAKEVYDVTGAGDTVIATLTAAVASGFNIKNAVAISNAAASVVVGKMGTATVTIEDIEHSL